MSPGPSAPLSCPLRHRLGVGRSPKCSGTGRLGGRGGPLWVPGLSTRRSMHGCLNNCQGESRGVGPYVRAYGALAHCSNALRISGISSSLVDQLTNAARMAGFPAKKVGVSSTRPSFLSASRKWSRRAAFAPRRAKQTILRRTGANSSKCGDCSIPFLAQEIVDHLHKCIELAAVNIMRGSVDLDSAAVRGQILLRLLPGSVI